MYILHLQKYDAIYNALEEMNPMLSNPFAFYETFVEGEEESHKAAAKVAREVEKAAQKA